MSKIHETLRRVQQAKRGRFSNEDDTMANKHSKFDPKEWLLVFACVTAGAALASVWLGATKAAKQQKVMYRTMNDRFKKQWAAYEASQRAAQSRLLQLEKRINELEAVRRDLSSLKQKNTTLNERIERLRFERTQLEKEIETLRRHQVELSTSQQRLEDQLNTLESVAVAPIKASAQETLSPAY